MVTRHLIPEDIATDYEVQEWRNATGVLQTAHLNEWQDIIEACEISNSGVTRASNLQAIFRSLGRKSEINMALPRIEGGGGGGCPILAFGITSAKYVEDNAPIIAEQASENGDGDSDWRSCPMFSEPALFDGAR
jgi:hypothetical protein